MNEFKLCVWRTYLLVSCRCQVVSFWCGNGDRCELVHGRIGAPSWRGSDIGGGVRCSQRLVVIVVGECSQKKCEHSLLTKKFRERSQKNVSAENPDQSQFWEYQE